MFLNRNCEFKNNISQISNYIAKSNKNDDFEAQTKQLQLFIIQAD